VRELKEYVERNRDWELVQIYEDKITGVKESRPELDHLLRDARLGAFNHVVFWKVSRLGRSALHTYQIIEEWKKLGITFSVMTLGMDTNTPSGKFIFGIMAQFAELERENIVEQTNLAMKNIKKQIEKDGKYKTKEGKIILKLGRPKGSTDKKPRKKRGYYLRDYTRRGKNPNLKSFPPTEGRTKLINNRCFISNGKKWVKRSHIVMESHIGRKLSIDEVVHHKNLNRMDDRIENLELMIKKEHDIFHTNNNKKWSRANFSKNDKVEPKLQKKEPF
jgi:DNA invertase Pin-like site-specific DNA recombinase